MLAHLVHRRALAETGNVGVFLCALIASPGMVGIGDAGDVFFRQLAVGAVGHAAQFTRVDEQDFTATVTEPAFPPVAGEKPKTCRYLRRVE